MFDRRSRVFQPHIFPWSTHGYLECVFSEGFIHRGTGTLISESCLMTAAHCLYAKNKNGKLEAPVEISFTVGLQRDGKYAWRSLGKQFKAHPGYIENDEEEAYDFAVIKLEENIGKQTGWASLGIVDGETLKNTTVNITGYPGQKGLMDILLKRPTYEMYTMSGPIVFVKGHKIYYKIDTSGGQSGAGVWAIDDKGKLQCIAIHTTGSKLEGNGGIRINETNFGLINEWIRELERKE